MNLLWFLLVFLQCILATWFYRQCNCEFQLYPEMRICFILIDTVFLLRFICEPVIVLIIL